MDDYALKQQLVGELKETLRIKQLNLELMDSMESTILFLINESKKTGIELPNGRHIRSLLSQVKKIYNELYPRSTETLHQKNQPQNGQSLKTITL